MKKVLIIICLLLIAISPGSHAGSVPETETQEPVRASYNTDYDYDQTILEDSRAKARAFVVKVQEEITLSFVGDVMMDGSVRSAIKKHGVDYPFIHVKKDIEQSDYAILNLETAITTKTKKFDKDFNFKSDPLTLKGLTNAGFDMVSLGNNHTMDYYEEGLTDTFKYLKEYKLEYVGAGMNDKEAYASKTVEIKGKIIKFLGFSRVLPDVSWYARKNKPGIASGYQEERVVKIIQSEKKDVDYLFVTIHWGKEKKTIPEDYQKKYARKMIDAGADGIIGHHPHVLQGFEYYKGKPIAYSLGNFLFPDYVTGKKAETGILKLKINESGISLLLKPYLIKANQITPLSQKEQDRILKEVKRVSFGVKFNGYEITK